MSVGTNFVWRMTLLKRKACFTGVHFAREVWGAMSGQGKSTIDPGAATGFMSRTVQSARNTVSCAQLPGVLNCCLVIAVMWAHCSHAWHAVGKKMPDETLAHCRQKGKEKKRKGNEIERRCTCFRGTASVNAVTTGGYGVSACREAFERGLKAGKRRAWTS